jgi:hypothetical protein
MNTSPPDANKTQGQALIGHFCAEVWAGMRNFSQKIFFFSHTLKIYWALWHCTDFVHQEDDTRQHGRWQAKSA